MSAVDPHAPEQSALESIERDLLAADRALTRIEEGTYGSCVVCGASLEPDVLVADPLVEHCGAHTPDVSAGNGFGQTASESTGVASP